MTDDAPALLIDAEAILRGSTHLPRNHTTRAAAWLARTALELLVIARLDARGVDARRATMRSQLSCLRILDPEFAGEAGIIWVGLSRCCHHHAYELAPSAAEVKHHLDLLRQHTK